MSIMKVSNGVVGVVVLAGWLSFLLVPAAIRELRTIVLDMDVEPWFTATIEVHPDRRDMNGDPSVTYTVHPRYNLDGRWSAWVEIADDSQVHGCGGGAEANYVKGVSTKEHSFDYFLGDDCSEPEVHYRLCAEYRMTKDQSVQFIGPVCSPIVYPTSHAEKME